MSIYTIGQLKASLVSKGYGDHWEEASGGDAVCMYVRLIQESKKGEWDTINVEDTANYFGVSQPRTCPKSSFEVNNRAKEKSESYFKGLFGEVLELHQDLELESSKSQMNYGSNDFALSLLLLGVCAYKVIKK